MSSPKNKTTRQIDAKDVKAALQKLPSRYRLDPPPQLAAPTLAAPETLLRLPCTLPASNSWTLGCLLYRMLGGVQPFVRNGKLDERLLLEQTPPPLAELVPADVELPSALVDQLAAHGRLVIPVGPPQAQSLRVVERKPGGGTRERELGAVTFVPLLSGKI